MRSIPGFAGDRCTGAVPFRPRFQRSAPSFGNLPGARLGERVRAGETALFSLEENELEDLGDVPLLPFPIAFSQVSPCGNLRPDGGVCRFSVRITNRLNVPVNGAAWSLVQAFGTGSLTDFTNFQISTVRKMTIPPGRSRVALFSFEVPATVRNGTNACVEMFFGEDRRNPFFNTVGRQQLFCIQKGLSGAVTVLSEKESRRLIREMKKGAGPGGKNRQ
jgi:hypothetical protein